MSEASTIQPDPTAMLRHVELVFGGGFDGALDGLVELAWTDPATGSLRNAQMFGTDQLEELVERAAELNRNERCNVYVGAALRKPGTALAKRTADSDFHSAPFAWADIDDDCVEAAIKAAKAAGVPATMTLSPVAIPICARNSGGGLWTPSGTARRSRRCARASASRSAATAPSRTPAACCASADRLPGRSSRAALSNLPKSISPKMIARRPIGRRRSCRPSPRPRRSSRLLRQLRSRLRPQ